MYIIHWGTNAPSILEYYKNEFGNIICTKLQKKKYYMHIFLKKKKVQAHKLSTYLKPKT